MPRLHFKTCGFQQVTTRGGPRRTIHGRGHDQARFSKAKLQTTPYAGVKPGGLRAPETERIRGRLHI